MVVSRGTICRSTVLVYSLPLYSWLRLIRRSRDGSPRHERCASYSHLRVTLEAESHFKKRVAEIEAKERQLRNKTPAELQALYDQEYATLTAEYLANDEREEQERFFNQVYASADFPHWSKATYWTLDEATTLSLRKAPEIVN